MTITDEEVPRCPTCGRPMTAPGADRPGKARRDNDETAKKAALLQSEPKHGTLRRRILDLVMDAGSKGMTDEEIETTLNIQHTPRRLELVEGGWLKDSGMRRPTQYSKRQVEAIVWVATDAAFRLRGPGF